MHLSHNRRQMFAVGYFDDERHLRSVVVSRVDLQVVDVGFMLGDDVADRRQNARLVARFHADHHLKFTADFVRPGEMKNSYRGAA